VFVSHGTRDRVLPIHACSRRLVPELRQTGYQVRYREFEGGHVIPPAIVLDAVAWLGSPAPAT
jgi:predicted esterase